MENEAKKASKVWLVPTIIAAVLLVALIAFMLILGKGTKAVSDGTQTLAESVAPLKDGTAQLSDGVDQYTEGVDTIHKAMPTLTDGIQQYTEGVDTLNGYMEKLNAAAPELASGVQKLNDGSALLKANSGTLLAGVDTVSGGLDDLKAGVKKIESGAYADESALNVANEFLAAYNQDGTAAQKKNFVAAKAKEFFAPVISYYASAQVYAMLEPTYNSTQKTLGDVQNGIKAMTAYCTAVGNIGKAMQAGQMPATSITDDMVVQAITSQGANGQIVVATTKSLVSTYNAEKAKAWDAANSANNIQMVTETIYLMNGVQATTSQTLSTLGTFKDQAAKGATKEAEADAIGRIGSVSTALVGYAGVKANLSKVYDGIDLLKAGVNGTFKSGLAKYTDGVAQVADGVATLNSSVNGKNGLVSSVSQLYKDGSKKLAENSDALRDGVKQLADGAKQLSENSKALRDGASQLKDAAPALIDGIGQLKDGAKQVNGFTPVH